MMSFFSIISVNSMSYGSKPAFPFSQMFFRNVLITRFGVLVFRGSLLQTETATEYENNG